jgi:hypothetical protein
MYPSALVTDMYPSALVTDMYPSPILAGFSSGDTAREMAWSSRTRLAA